MKRYKIFNLLLISMFAYSCSIGQILTKMTEKPIKNVQLGFLRESNVEFGREALPGIIKFAEGMNEYYPNAFYAEKLTFLYSAYSFAFFDQSPFDDLDENSFELQKNMLDFYDRAYRYGLQSMDLSIKDFSKKLLNGDLSVLEKVKKDQIEGLYWLTFAWAMRILNQTDDPYLVAQLATVKALVDRAYFLDSSYMNGAVFAMYVAFYGARTPTLGGDLEKTKKYYEEGEVYAKGKSLILDYVYLRYVTTLGRDSADFDKAYRKIEGFEIDDAADAFINGVIKQKARDLNRRKASFF